MGIVSEGGYNPSENEAILAAIPKENFVSIGEEIVKHSNGIIRMAYNESDKSKKKEPEAAHFLKYQEKRFGRDLELYGFIALMSNEEALVLFLQEIVLPLKNLKLEDSFKHGGKILKDLGLTVFPEEMQKDWEDFFN